MEEAEVSEVSVHFLDGFSVAEQVTFNLFGLI